MFAVGQNVRFSTWIVLSHVTIIIVLTFGKMLLEGNSAISSASCTWIHVYMQQYFTGPAGQEDHSVKGLTRVQALTVLCVLPGELPGKLQHCRVEGKTKCVSELLLRANKLARTTHAQVDCRAKMQPCSFEQQSLSITCCQLTF